MDQITSALVQTGAPAGDPENDSEAAATREGGGIVDLPEANDPRLFASPSTLSLGLLRVGSNRRATVDLTDAGGGAGSWNVSVRLPAAAGGVKLTVPQSVTVPGSLAVLAEAQQTAAEADVTGFIVLQRGHRHAEDPVLAQGHAREAGATCPCADEAGPLRGEHANRPRPCLVVPLPRRSGRLRGLELAAGAGAGVPHPCPGLGRQRRRAHHPAAARRQRHAPARLRRGREPAGRHSRLPVDINPYRGNLYGDLRPVVAANRPSAGAYDVVFETRSRAVSGPFSFRVWIDDKTPPRVKLLTPAATSSLTLSVADSGSGVDPRSITVLLDGRREAFVLKSGRLARAAGERRTGHAPARRQRRGLPGDEELGERRRDPPEHDGLPKDVPRPLAVGLAILDGGQVVEVALDALFEVVAVGANDLEL